jgi:hypothetical protein
MLFLYGTKVTDNGLKALATFPNLKSLGLRGEKYTDEGLVHIASIKKLESLYLNKTWATQNGIKKLQMRLPKLSIRLRQIDTRQ